MKTFLGNNKGFSLAELMVAAGLVGILAVATMNIMKTQSTGMIHLEAKNDEISFFRNVSLQLSIKEACTQTFSGKSVDSSIDELKNSKGNDFVSIGKKVSTKKVTVSSMELTNVDVPSSGGEGMVNLEVVLTRELPNKDPQNIKKQFPINVKADGSGNILECYAQADADLQNVISEVCEKFGGVLEESSKNCVLNDSTNKTKYEIFSKEFVQNKFKEVNKSIKDIDKRVVINEGDIKINKNEITRVFKEVNKLRKIINNYHGNEGGSGCEGPGGRTRYRVAKAIDCRDEMEVQFRSCNNGSWGSWSGSYSQKSCDSVECLNGNTETRTRTVAATAGNCDDTVYNESRSCSQNTWSDWGVTSQSGGQCYSPNH